MGNQACDVADFTTCCSDSPTHSYTFNAKTWTCASWDAYPANNGCSSSSDGYVQSCAKDEDDRVTLRSGAKIPFEDAYGSTCTNGSFYYAGYWEKSVTDSFRENCPV